MKKLLLILLCLPMIGFGQDANIPFLYVPNSFTPNNDGKNDIFQPKMSGIADFEMFIYNRRGVEIFHSFGDGWNGYTDTGGIYIYLINVIDIFNKTYTYKGAVTLIN